MSYLLFPSADEPLGTRVFLALALRFSAAAFVACFSVVSLFTGEIEGINRSDSPLSFWYVAAFNVVGGALFAYITCVELRQRLRRLNEQRAPNDA